MFEKTEAQSRGWRLFAICAAAITLPIAMRAGSTTEWLKSVVATVALLGLAGYAFGFRVGPQAFWRAFTVVFALAVMWWLGRQAAPALHGIPAEALRKGQSPTALAMGFAFFIALSLALFRHSGWVAAPAPGGGNKAEPLFPSRAEQRRRIQETMAATRAELEKPMSGAMQAEAMSFGPHRQLSYKQHQRITSIMFVGTLAMQIVLAVISGTTWILLPAVALVVGCAVATSMSAENILKSLPRLSVAWKAAGLFTSLTGTLFFFRESMPLKIWLCTVIFADVAALILGNLVVSTMYAFRQRH